MSLNCRPELIVIDLDGTLIDSVPDLAYSVDEMMKLLEKTPWGETKVRHWVGNGVERLVKRALTDDLQAEPDTELYARAFPLFMEIYAANTSGRSQLYPGVASGLQTLQQAGYQLACVTNKAAAFTLPLLADKGIKDYFSVIVSGDTTAKKKPDPMPLLYAAEKCGIDPQRCLMVGDSMHDVAAARNASFAVVAVPYGYNHGNDIRDAKPDAVIDSLDELNSLLEQIA